MRTTLKVILLVGLLADPYLWPLCLIGLYAIKK